VRRLTVSFAVVFGLVLASAGIAEGAVTVSPAPGAPGVLPQTQISILGVRPGRITSVRAVGSSSGRHSGQLRAYTANAGASFIPAQAFGPGERVNVTLKIKGQRARRWHFRIGHPVALQPVLHPTGKLVLDPAKLDHFQTAPLLLAPVFKVLHRSQSAIAHDLLLTPLPSPTIHPGSKSALQVKVVGPGGPMIVNPKGQLVWFSQLPSPDVAGDLQMQRYGGQTVLSWWQGGVEPQAFGVGYGVIVDHHYRVIGQVHAGNGYQADIHELKLIPGRRALITAYAPIRLTAKVHGRRRTVIALNSVVQEIDVPTGLVMWEWDGLGHIALKNTYAPVEGDGYWDPFHLNSIQWLGNGRLVISARDTSSIYDVQQSTGKIRWTLGGRHSSFKLSRPARFWLQHDARLFARGRELSLFDDEAGPPARAKNSRGLILRLNFRSHRASVVRSLRRRGKTLANSEGSTQTLPGGGSLVGYGSTRYVSAFNARGRLDFDSALPEGDSTYRAFEANWHATPSSPPLAVAHSGSGGKTTVYVSWNGATDVARWQVTSGGRQVASAANQGFETTIQVTAAASGLSVRPFNAAGHALAGATAVTEGGA
jgi:hypothetical protein